MAEFLMPSLGADMQAGTLVAWRKQPGQAVARGEIIAEVETEKGVIEVECFTAGVVAEHLVAPGTKVPVGTKLASIREGAAGEPARAVAPPVAPPVVPTSVPMPAGPVGRIAAVEAPATPSARVSLRERGLDARDVHGTGPHGTITRQDVLAATARGPLLQPGAPNLPPAQPAMRALVSPLARRLAKERGVSLDGVRGSGPLGSVVAQDIERAARERPPEAATPLDAQARMRRAIAQSMSRSKREIPHYYLSHTVDLHAALAWLDAENAKRAVPDRLLAGVLFVRAVALAVRKAPELNAHWLDDHAPPLPDVHVGVAVSLRGGGLVAPAIHDADKLTLDELSRAFKDVVNRARAGQLRSSELSDPTITITSLGERGVETVFPIIIPPQVAMVGFGTVVTKPMVVDGSVLARPTVTITLAADHRVSDGHRGGLFLAALANLLKEAPKP